MADYRILELSSFTELQEAVVSEGLAQEVADGDFFCTCAWYANLATSGLAPANLLLLLAINDTAGSALCLPLQYNQQGLSSLSNYYSSLYGPIMWGNHRPQTVDPSVWRALAEHLRQHRPRWPMLSLSPLDSQHPCYQGLRDALNQVGYTVDHFFCFGNWYLQVAGRSFSDYALSLPSALRNSIARGQRRLSKQGEWNIHIQCLDDARLETSINAFVQVYQRSWKQAEPHPNFIPQLIGTAARQGWLRLGILMLQGQAIAAQLWLVKDNKASIYKLAYAEGFERFSAGSVLTHALMQQVLDGDLVHEVDYLTGDDTYKQDWMSHRRERWGLVAFNKRTIKGIWTATRHFGGKLRKRAQQGMAV